jgi:NAD(P)-dependent dehydrogenase (short-subunit alcohol dehydrogenase family)
MSGTRTALVTGANRGIGLEVCRQLTDAGLAVVLCCRDVEHGQAAARGLRAPVRVEQLDVSDRSSVDSCVGRLAEQGVEIDILVNNAGWYPTEPFFSVSEDVMARSLEVNLLGAFRLCHALVPAMVQRRYGRVVNVSSGGGAMTEGTPSPAAYGIAKAALNALTKVVADAVPPATVKVNAMCPGWVRTRMGGQGAPLTPSQGADTITWLALLPANGPSGGFFRDRRPIAW